MKGPLVVKGFYVGMSPSEVYGILDSFGLTNHADYKSSFLGFEGRTTTAADYKRRYGLGGKIDIWYDQADKMAALEIQPPMVDSLFNVADLSLEAFAQQFAKNYGLPEMQALSSREGWNYRDDESGIEVVIYSSRGKLDKRLCLRKIPKATERKFEQAQTAKGSFSIKGFQIGMSRDAAKQRLEALDLKLDAKNGMGESLDSPTRTFGYSDTVKRRRSAQVEYGNINVYYDPNGGADKIIISGAEVDHLFNAADMDSEEFAQQFMASSGIKKMERITAPLSGWRFKNEAEGYEVIIGDGKAITLQRVPKASERKFD